MIRILSLIVSLILAAGCSFPNDLRRSSTKLEEMKTMAKRIPNFPTAIDVGTKERYGVGTAIFGKRYKTDANYDELKDFYLEKLRLDGWVFHSARSISSSTAKLIQFCKGEYSLTVEFAGKGEAHGWNYSWDIVWPDNEICHSVVSTPASSP